MTDALKPCPFCGAGKTDLHPNGRMWTGQRYSEPTSVSIRHWCEDVAGQPHRMIERVGRDEAGAIEAWNRRAALAAPPVGWVLVPVEPTPAMREAMWREVSLMDYMQGVRAGWSAALAAAPGAPDAQKGAA